VHFGENEILSLSKLRLRKVMRAYADFVSSPKPRICRVCCKVGMRDGLDGTQVIMMCGGCLLAYYCSREGQTADWQRHKPLCRPLNPVTCCQCCWKEGAKLMCGRCNAAVYCDAVCQKAHWTDKHVPHKAMCVK
jgi:hypothetical protein